MHLQTQIPSLRLFDKRTSFSLALCFLMLIFLPKINLVSLGQRESAGIRIDDILLLFFAIIFFWAHRSLAMNMGVLEKRVGAIIALSLISFSLNRMLVAEGLMHVHASLFYCFRLAEYFLFFYVGILCSQFFSLTSVIKAFFAWNFLLMLLQKAGFIGQFFIGVYTPSAQDRVSGIASFPSEAGMLLNMIFCVLLYTDPTWRFSRLLPAYLREFFKYTYVYWLFIIFAILTIWTGSRIAIVAMSIVFLFKLKNNLNFRSLHMVLFGGLFLVGGGMLMLSLIENTDSVFSRSAGLFSWRNLELIGKVWQQIDISYEPIGNEAVRYDKYDMSWWIRIHKWIYALKVYFSHPECYLQGIGPGFGMAALDGGFVRVLTENGLIGCLLYGKVFKYIYNQSLALKWVVIAFMFNMIFFDVYIAYKPMSLLFFISGYTYSACKNRSWT